MGSIKDISEVAVFLEASQSQVEPASPKTNWVAFPVAVAQFLIKDFGGNGFCGSQFKGSVHHGGEGMAVGHEAPGHRASTVRKQREVKVGLSPRSSLCSVLDPSLGNGSLLL